MNIDNQNPAAVTPPATPATPAAGAPPAILTPPGAASPTAPTVEPKVGDPDWLNGRIAKAKQSAESALLKSLGVATADEAKAAIEAAKAKADAEKTAAERAAELKAKLDGESAKTAEQGKIIAEYAARQMVGLTAEQTAAVKAIAGDDPGKQLSTIAALQPTWAKTDASSSTAQSATAPKTAPDTAPGHTAPNGAATSPPNARAAYEAARKVNPFAAAEYGLRNDSEVYKSST